jgi:HlyD family secretion protein
MSEMRRWFYLGGALVIVVAAYFGLRAIRSARGQAAGGGWQTVPASTGELVASVGATGTVRANQYSLLSFKTTGNAERVNVGVGDHVVAGQVLASLTPSSLPSTVILAQADLAEAQRALDDLRNSDAARAAAQLALANARQAYDTAQRRYVSQQKGNRATQETINATEADLAYAESQVDAAQDAVDRVSNRAEDDPDRVAAEKALYDARHARDVVQASLNWYTGQPTAIDQQILEAELAQAAAAVKDAEREWERLKDGPDPNDIAAAEARVQAAQANLELPRITAPFSGTITSVEVRPGDEVGPGTSAFGLADLSRMLVDVQVSEVDIDQISLKQEATITFDAILAREYHGTVSEVDLVGAPNQGVVSFNVSIELTDADDSVRQGLTAAVSIVTDKLEDVLLVPNRAVRVVNGRRVVYVLQNGNPEQVPVELGVSSDTDSQLLSGDLKPEDPIILNPPLTFDQSGPPAFLR